jgi:hypothetical protein
MAMGVLSASSLVMPMSACRRGGWRAPRQEGENGAGEVRIRTSSLPALKMPSAKSLGSHTDRDSLNHIVPELFGGKRTFSQLRDKGVDQIPSQIPLRFHKGRSCTVIV